MTPKSPHDINKYSDIFEELTGIYPLNVRGALATDGRDVVIFKIVEEDMMTGRFCGSTLTYIEINVPNESGRTVNVSYFVDTLLEAKYKRDRLKTAPSEYEPGSIIPPSPESGIIAPLPEQVYTVAYGRYDDYRIAAVFTTEEKAQRYADLQNKLQMQKWGVVLDEYYCDDTLDLDPSI